MFKRFANNSVILYSSNIPMFTKNLYFTFITILFLLSGSVFSQSRGTLELPSDTLFKESRQLFDADSMLIHASKFIGKRYHYRGTSPKTGFDCSGYVLYNFKRYGIPLPHSSYEQIKFGEKIKVADTKAGDLIFFKGRSTKSKMAGHVGIVVSVKDNVVKFIHSSTSLGVRYDFTNANYYKIRFLGIRRLTKETSVSTKSR